MGLFNKKQVQPEKPKESQQDISPEGLKKARAERCTKMIDEALKKERCVVSDTKTFLPDGKVLSHYQVLPLDEEKKEKPDEKAV